jgi:hypothetical protein
MQLRPGTIESGLADLLAAVVGVIVKLNDHARLVSCCAFDHSNVVASGIPSVPTTSRSIRSIGFVFEDLSLGTDVKQVPGLAVLNFDFVIPFAVPFRFQNVTRRVTGFDCFQYRPRQPIEKGSVNKS